MRREVVVKVGLLGKKTDLRLDIRIGPIAPQNTRRSRGGEYQAHQELQGRCLPCSIRSEKAEDLPLFYREVQRMQGALRPLAPEPNHVSFFETKNFNGSHGHSGQ